MRHSRSKSHLQLFLLVMIFVLPIIVSWILYQYHDHFQFKKMNHGSLVNPAIQVPYLLTENSKEKIWHIIHVENEKCDEQCQKIDFQLSQVVKALGKDRNRLKIVLINNHHQNFSRLQMAFDPRLNVTSKIFLVDPLGNLFMYYPDTINPMNILKDLKRVLEVSQIG